MLRRPLSFLASTGIRGDRHLPQIISEDDSRIRTLSGKKFGLNIFGSAIAG
jgi:hypothetical protein